MREQAPNKMVVGALQLGITLVLTAFYLYLILSVKMNPRLLSILGISLGIFGLAVWETKDKWQYSRYWVFLLGCLIVHLCLVALLRVFLGELPTAILGFFGTLEFGVLFWILLNAGE